MFYAKCKELEGNFDNLDWIYGLSNWGENVAFRPAKSQGPFSYIKGTLSLIVDIVLCSYCSKDSKEANKGEELHRFNAIDFCGESIDAIFSPKCIFESITITENKIEWSSVEDYAKSFKTIIGKIPCALIFTVFVDRKDIDRDETSLGTLRSILRLEFEEPQDVSLIEECWQSACYFLTFCTGHFNVSDFRISLWDEKKPIGTYGAPGVIDCQINSTTVENIKYTGQPYNRFQVSWLNDKVGRLFELIACKDSRPRLGFLPRTNTDIDVDSHEVRELCTAFEVEYQLREKEFEPDEPKELVEILKKTIRDYKKNHSGELSEDIYNSVVHLTLLVLFPFLQERKFGLYIHNVERRLMLNL